MEIINGIPHISKPKSFGIGSGKVQFVYKQDIFVFEVPLEELNTYDHLSSLLDLETANGEDMDCILLNEMNQYELKWLEIALNHWNLNHDNVYVVETTYNGLDDNIKYIAQLEDN